MDKLLHYEVRIHESNFYNVDENIILSYVPLAHNWNSWLKESLQYGSEVHELRSYTKRLKQTKLT